MDRKNFIKSLFRYVFASVITGLGIISVLKRIAIEEPHNPDFAFCKNCAKIKSCSIPDKEKPSCNGE